MARERPQVNEGINSRVLVEYDLPLDKAKAVKGGYQIDTYEGRRLLKQSRANPEALTLAHEAVSYLLSRGFQNIAPIRLTKYGDPWVLDNGQVFYLTDWIGGKECQLKRPAQLMEGVQLLAKMQSAGFGFTPTPAPGRERWHTWSERYQARVAELERYRELVEKGDISSEFDSLFITEVDGFIEQGRLSLRLLEMADYKELVEEARQEGGICHRDFVGRNLIQNRRKEIFVVNFDNCQLDIKIFDLGRLLSWSLPSLGWDFDLTVNLLSRYQEVIALKKDDYLVLASYLNFPQRLWFLARGVYLEPTSDGNAINGLQDILVEQPVHQDFIRQFINHYQLSV